MKGGVIYENVILNREQTNIVSSPSTTFVNEIVEEEKKEDVLKSNHLTICYLNPQEGGLLMWIRISNRMSFFLILPLLVLRDEDL